MLDLKKSLVTLSAVTMLVASIPPMTAFAESSEKIATANELEQNSNVQKQKSLTVDDVLNNPQWDYNIKTWTCTIMKKAEIAGTFSQTVFYGHQIKLCKIVLQRKFKLER